MSKGMVPHWYARIQDRYVEERRQELIGERQKKPRRDSAGVKAGVAEREQDCRRNEAMRTAFTRLERVLGC